jgi:serine/threonine protein kinase
MGEVYRARDLRLKRDVAIKILPDEFSLDTGRVSRFQREAEVLAIAEDFGLVLALLKTNRSKSLTPGKSEILHHMLN